MKTIKIFIPFFLSIILLASCEKDIEFSGKITDSLIVLNSIISPDSVITAQISKSKFFLADDATFDIIDYAEVSVFINGTFKEKLTYTTDGIYTSSFIPNAGDTVLLKTAASGMKSVSCQTVITPKPIVLSVDTIIEQLSCNQIVEYNRDKYGYIISTDTTGANLNYQMKIKIKIQDNAKERNYYRLMALVTPSGNNKNYNYSYSYLNIVLEGVLSGNQNDPTNLINSGTVNEYNIFPDELFNGKEFTVVFTLTGSNYIKLGDSEPHYLNINLQNMSSDYYKYLYTSGQSLSSDGFFTEPVQIYNNVQGGIGILGAYNNNNNNNSARINLLDLYEKAKVNENNLQYSKEK